MKHISILIILLLASFSLSAQTVQIGSWKTDEFTTTYTEKTWDFSQNISAGIKTTGTYNIVFTYTGGRRKLCLKEAIIKADGKEVLSVAGERSAGTNPKSISYTFELGAVPKKLTLTAKARTDGGTNSNGKIELTVSDIVGGILTIPEGTTEIKNKAYYGSTAIKKVIIPSTVTKIGDQAFKGCSNLTEIDIPSSVETIGKEAFLECVGLEKVTLHEGLKKISFRAFKKTGIKKIIIPASVTEFGDYVFAECSALTEIEIPSSVTTFGKGILNDCPNLTAIKVDKYSESHAALSVYPAVVFTNNKPKQTKEQWIASSKYDILDDGILYVAKGVKKIGDGLYKNKGIKEIRFSDTVEVIGEGAFQGNKELKKVVIPGNVKTIGTGAFAGLNLEEVVCEEGVERIGVYAFYDCRKLNSVALPKSATKISSETGLHWQNKGSRVFHCYAGSQAYNQAVKSGFLKIDIVGIDEEHKDTIDLKYVVLGGNKTVKAGLFRDFPIERIDLNNDIVEIGKDAFHDKTLVRAKRNTTTDKCLRANGYYLCEVLSDLNIYTKDKSKKIKEDFTRIFSDYDPYWKWSTYKADTYNPLLLEEVDDKLVINSIMFYPCKNVTVTDKNGKVIIKNKTIQPFTRTELCDFDFLTDSVDNYTLTVNDDFYNKLIAGKVKWDMSFDFAVRRTTTPESVSTETFRPVYAREFIAGMYNVAYIIGSEEYERRCYEAVDKKLLVTDEALTVPLTREQMEKLLKKTKKWSFILGRDNMAGTGGGNILTMATDFILSFSNGAPSAFWHEFSHCMGWGHNHGNMCYLGRPKPYHEDWPSIGSKVYQEEFKKGNTPYTYDKYYLNSFFFSQPDIRPPNVEGDTIKNETLYIADGMPKSGTFKNRTDFTKVVIPSSVSLISNSAFSGTLIKEVTIPSEVGKIGNNAFNSCNELESVIIPNSVKILGNEAFQNCVKLSTAKIGSGLRQLNSKLFKGAGLTNITIPGNIKFIDKEAFQDCKKLSKIVIEDGVRKIGNSAFNGTAIKEIKIPKSVTEIGKNIVPKETVWIVKKGSYAESYCTENNIEFKYAE